MTTEDRFWAKVVKGPECWDWTGARTAPGWHGRFYVDGRIVMAHRYAWERAYGPVPLGLNVLHSCDNAGCVRPDHLMVGTQHANMRDASQKGRMVREVRLECRRGHPFAGNTYIHPSTGRRICRVCHIERARRWHADHPAERQPAVSRERLGPVDACPHGHTGRWKIGKRQRYCLECLRVRSERYRNMKVVRRLGADAAAKMNEAVG